MKTQYPLDPPGGVRSPARVTNQRSPQAKKVIWCPRIAQVFLVFWQSRTSPPGKAQAATPQPQMAEGRLGPGSRRGCRQPSAADRCTKTRPHTTWRMAVVCLFRQWRRNFCRRLSGRLWKFTPKMTTCRGDNLIGSTVAWTRLRSTHLHGWGLRGFWGHEGSCDDALGHGGR